METAAEVYYEKIKCPECKTVQRAKVEVPGGFPLSKIHICIFCSAIITDAEWEEVYNYSQDAIICPYCAHRFTDSWELADADGEDIECERCGKTFHLTVEHNPEYTTQTDCELDGVDHDWYESASITSSTRTYYNCKKCDMSKVEDKEDMELQ